MKDIQADNGVVISLNDADADYFLERHKVATRSQMAYREAKPFKGHSVKDAADLVMVRISKVPGLAAYAGNPARGDYRGFAALHDKVDANMLLPLYGEKFRASDQAQADFQNAVMSLVTFLLILDWEPNKGGWA